MPPKKSTTVKKKKADAITAVELVDTTPLALPAALPEVLTVVQVPVKAELQAEPAELEVIVVGDFNPQVKPIEPDDIRDAAADADEAFSFAPPDAEPASAERRPEWLQYEHDDHVQKLYTGIQENQHLKLMVPSHSLRATEDSDIETDIAQLV